MKIMQKRKTRKWPDMSGSIRRYKKFDRDLKFAIKTARWQSVYFKNAKSPCEPIVINPNLQ